MYLDSTGVCSKGREGDGCCGQTTVFLTERRPNGIDAHHSQRDSKVNDSESRKEKMTTSLTTRTTLNKPRDAERKTRKHRNYNYAKLDMHMNEEKTVFALFIFRCPFFLIYYCLCRKEKGNQ